MGHKPYDVTKACQIPLANLTNQTNPARQHLHPHSRHHLQHRLLTGDGADDLLVVQLVDRLAVHLDDDVEHLHPSARRRSIWWSEKETREYGHRQRETAIHGGNSVQKRHGHRHWKRHGRAVWWGKLL